MMNELEMQIGLKKVNILKELIWVDRQIKLDNEDDDWLFRYKILYRDLVDGLEIEQRDKVDDIIDYCSHMDIYEELI